MAFKPRVCSKESGSLLTAKFHFATFKPQARSVLSNILLVFPHPFSRLSSQEVLISGQIYLQDFSIYDDELTCVGIYLSLVSW